MSNRFYLPIVFLLLNIITIRSQLPILPIPPILPILPPPPVDIAGNVIPFPGVMFFPTLFLPEAHHRHSYFIAASKKISPGQVYKITVTILPDADSSLELEASIKWNGSSLAVGKQTFLPNSHGTFPLRVKTMLAEGDYELTIEGHFKNAGPAASFKHRAPLELETRSINIIIRTDKPLYHQAESVYFRVIPLTPQLTQYQGVVDVYIYNPDGYLQRRYPAVHSNLGVVSIEFKLAPELKFGNWKIRAQIGANSGEIEFPVEEFDQTLFEVNVTQPISIIDTEDFFTGSIQTNFTWGQSVKGNCIVEVFLLGNDDESLSPYWDGKESLSIFQEYFFGVMDFAFSMEKLKLKANGNLEGMILAVRATVSDYWYNETRTGYSQTKVFNNSARLTFLGHQPQVFKPGMIFTTHLGVSQQNGAPIQSHFPSYVEVRTLIFHESGGGIAGETRSQVIRVPDNGIIFLEVFVPHGVAQLVFEAYDIGDFLVGLKREPYEVTEASKTRMSVLRMQTVFDHVLQVTSTTRNVKVGGFIILNVKASYFVQKLNWIVTSKGMVVISGQEDVRSISFTFSIAATAEMAPTANVVVFEILSTGVVIADKITFPVDGISRNNFSMSINHHKDYYKRTFEVFVFGDPLSFVGFSAVDRNLIPLTPGITSLSRWDILRSLHSAESGKYGQGAHGMTFISADGFTDSSAYFSTNAYGIDAFTIFDQADLVVFSDARIPRVTLPYCDESLGELVCVSGGCYKKRDKCDGKWDCRDGTDEGMCDPIDAFYDDMLEFRRARFNRLERSFSYGACCWKDGNISPEGHFIVKIPMSERPFHFVFTAISMSETSGLGVLDYSVTFDSVKPFHMILEAADTIHQGEQVSLRCALFNYYEQEMEVLLTLHGSEDYAFIEVGPFGTTQSYHAKRVLGTIHHTVWMDEQTSTIVYIPIVPRRLGEITVNITAATQIGEFVENITIYVIADGVKMHYHTAIPIDLTNKGTIQKLLDIQTTENSTVPRQIERLFVLGSPKATVSAAGDIFGPILDIIDAQTMLGIPHQGGEMSVFSYAMNLYALDFLRRTNQLTDVVMAKQFNELNSFYQTILNYQDNYGPFHQFMNETMVPNSVWLTAFAVQIFEESRRLMQFADWEDYLYIDPLITEQSVRWVLRHQASDGSFFEPLLAPYDRKMSFHTCQPRLEQLGHCNWLENTNATLTAQIVISLKEIESSSGNLGSMTIPARSMAVRYLERVLDLLFDPYEIAIVTYALTITDSHMKDAAFEKLDGIKRYYDRYLYWGKEEISPPDMILRKNFEHLAHLPNTFESTNIAATSFALMTYNLRRSFLAERIAAWLNTQRLHNAGFSSTQDTFMAMKALMHYSYFSNVREATDLNITITASSSPGFEKILWVNQRNLSTLQSVEIPRAWGQIKAVARGSGYALLQLDVEYTVDHPRYIVPPPVSAFEVYLEITYIGRNNSILILKPCARWTLFSESPQSGMAVIEVDIPSGYIVHQPDLEDYCGSHANPLMRYAEFYDGKISFFFDYLDGGLTCVEVVASRWFPVANSTRWLTLKVFDYYAPERFNTSIHEATPLYAQNICLVCGSFQCPYCPDYNAAPLSAFPIWSIVQTLFIVIFNYIRKS